MGVSAQEYLNGLCQKLLESTKPRLLKPFVHMLNLALTIIDTPDDTPISAIKGACQKAVEDIARDLGWEG